MRYGSADFSDQVESDVVDLAREYRIVIKVVKNVET